MKYIYFIILLFTITINQISIADDMWKQKLPLGGNCKVKIVGKQVNNKEEVNEKTLYNLEGYFTMKHLPQESTFIEFKKKHPMPEISLMPESINLLLEWGKKYYIDGYSGIEGKINGDLRWSVSPTTFRLGNLIAVCEGLPDKTIQVTGVINGGFWLDGISLWIGPSEGDPQSKWIFNAKKQCRLVPSGDEYQMDIDTTIDAWNPDEGPPWIGGGDAPCLKYVNTPQNFTYYNMGWSKLEVEITLTCDCPLSPEQFIVETKRDTPDWKPNNSNDRKKLKELRGKPIPPEQDMGGWTQSEIPKPKVNIDWNLNKSAVDPNMYCLWVDKIAISQFVGITMYIVSEYSLGSCPYKAIQEHEIKHVEISTTTIDKFLDKMKTLIQISPSIPSKARPLRVSTSEIDKSQITVEKEIHNIVWSIYKESLNEIKKLNEDLDSSIEYEKVRRKCIESDW